MVNPTFHLLQATQMELDNLASTLTTASRYHDLLPCALPHRKPPPTTTRVCAQSIRGVGAQVKSRFVRLLKPNVTLLHTFLHALFTHTRSLSLSLSLSLFARAPTTGRWLPGSQVPSNLLKEFNQYSGSMRIVGRDEEHNLQWERLLGNQETKINEWCSLCPNLLAIAGPRRLVCSKCNTQAACHDCITNRLNYSEEKYRICTTEWNWECLECRSCYVCGKDSESVLLCERCDRGFDLACVYDPPLPTQADYCPTCLDVLAGKRTAINNPNPPLRLTLSLQQPRATKLLGTPTHKAPPSKTAASLPRAVSSATKSVLSRGRAMVAGRRAAGPVTIDSAEGDGPEEGEFEEDEAGSMADVGAEMDGEAGSVEDHHEASTVFVEDTSSSYDDRSEVETVDVNNNVQPWSAAEEDFLVSSPVKTEEKLSEPPHTAHRLDLHQKSRVRGVAESPFEREARFEQERPAALHHGKRPPVYLDSDSSHDLGDEEVNGGPHRTKRLRAPPRKRRHRAPQPVTQQTVATSPRPVEKSSVGTSTEAMFAGTDAGPLCMVPVALVRDLREAHDLLAHDRAGALKRFQIRSETDPERFQDHWHWLRHLFTGRIQNNPAWQSLAAIELPSRPATPPTPTPTSPQTAQES
ncbi:uncharacterized protein MONBRDRAFT_32594 [Monosiga brevicollis MX1]|uniref:PHD-type domain-containing protein n=1 Tax=Monosiga brevicollis TaxID=81824 RepID=A9V0J4_MONBE|nr:uncharacterized protein MONBRDRAFT_32594 [Monosiga brevicollis MX1]EDQ89162.1 predicted protein [Monosiga brevicollis MX1]|eukprot:XP_001746267.1 hypothetical protein [Monosiga brevicollis MX1]